MAIEGDGCVNGVLDEQLSPVVEAELGILNWLPSESEQAIASSRKIEGDK